MLVTYTGEKIVFSAKNTVKTKYSHAEEWNHQTDQRPNCET